MKMPLRNSRTEMISKQSTKANTKANRPQEQTLTRGKKTPPMNQRA